MALNNSKALTLAGMAMVSVLTLTTAFAKPPKKTPPKKPVVTKADPVAGKKVYTANGCGGCHAIAGEGGSNGPDLTKYADDKIHDAKWTAVQIQAPSKHKTDSKMPAYADKIKGKDLDNIVAYLLTLKGA